MNKRKMGDNLEAKLSFCNALIESFGPRTSDFGSAMEESDEETAGALLAKMESLTQNDLLFGPCLDRLAEAGLLVSYLHSLLTALPAMKSSFIPATRQFIYFYSMKIFSQMKLSQDNVKILSEALQCNDCYLNDEQIGLIVGNSLTFMKGVSSLLMTQSQLASFNAFLDILISLSLKSNRELIRKVHRSLLSFNGGRWPPETVLIISSNLLELSESEEDCDMALKAMSKYVHWKTETTLSSASASASASASVLASSASADKTQYHIASDSLPALVYTITSFRIKCNNLISLKRKVFQQVISVVDTILAESSADFACVGREQQVRAILSTITHHLSLLVTKDTTLVAEIVSMLKNQDLLTTSTLERRDRQKCSRCISKAKLLLCLLVARAPNQEEKIVKGMTDLVKSIAKITSVSRNSIWFPPDVWKGVLEIRVEQLFLAFEQLVAGPLMADLLVAPLTAFAFSLLSDGAARSPGGSIAMASVVGAHVEFFPQMKCSAADEKNVEEFGIQLLLALFKGSEHSRVRIIEEIGVHLLIASDGSSNSALAPGSLLYNEMTDMWPGTPGLVQAQFSRSMGHRDGSSLFIDATNTARACVRVLTRVSRECAGILAYTNGSMKHLENIVSNVLGRMPPVLCEELIKAIVPLFDTWKHLFDKCMMCVNKACLSRDTNHRQAALASKICLVDCQTAQLRALASSSSSSSSALSLSRLATTNEMRSLADSIENNCAELRRFLQHQGDVRAMMYDRIYKLQCAHTDSRQHVMFLLFSHLMSMIKGEDDNVPKTISENRRNREYADLSESSPVIIDLDRCIDSSGVPVERLSGLMVTLLALSSETLSQYAACGIECTNSDSDEEDQSSVEKNEAHTIAIDICQHLWLLAQTITEQSVYTDFGQIDDEDAVIDRISLGKEVVMIDAVQALSTVVANLPSTLGGRRPLSSRDRLILLGKLALVHSQILSLHTRHILAIKKSQCKSTGKKRKGKGREVVDEISNIENVEQLIDQNKDFTQKSNDIIDDLPLFATENKRGLALHIVRARVAYAALVAGLLYNTETNSVPNGNTYSDQGHAISQMASQANEFDAASSELSDLEAFLLTRSALECALLSIESLLNRLSSCPLRSDATEIPTSSTSLTSAISPATDLVFEEIDRTVWSTMPLTIGIMNIVMQNTSCIAPSEVKNESLDIGSCFSELSVGELAFRCLLGLFRLHAMCGARQVFNHAPLDDHERDQNHCYEPNEELARTVINARLSQVTSLITNPIEFANTGRAFLVEKPETLENKTAVAASECVSPTGATTASDSIPGGSKDVLGKAVRVFVDILSNNFELYYRESASKHVKDMCSKCNPVIVPIISELLQYLRDAKRTKYLEKFVMLCDKKVREPSKALTRSLFRLFVYASNNTPRDRQRQMAEMSGAIKACMSKCDGAILYDEDQDEYVDSYEDKGKGVADYETTCRFVCRSSLKEASDELLTALSSVVGDAEALLRLYLKNMKGTKQRKSTLLSLTDAGCILSDDEEDVFGGSIIRRGGDTNTTATDNFQLSEMFVAMKGGFRCANDLVMPKGLRLVDSIKGWKTIVDRNLRVYTQLYALLGSIASGFLNAIIPSRRVEDFHKVAIFVGEKVTHAIDELILDLQQGSSASHVTSANSHTSHAGKKRRTNKNGGSKSASAPTQSSAGRQETLVPNLVYGMAQLDAKVVALSKKYKTVDFTKALPRNVQRDFKFNENIVNY